MDLAPFTENVIPQLLAWRSSGLNAALVTLVAVDGSAPRRVGSQMAVNEKAEFLGTISSGCAEAAIVAEAVEAIAASAVRTVRYGAGSPYVDVVLPCGSGIDVHFDPVIATTTLALVQTTIAAREVAKIDSVLADGTVFTRTFVPVPRIVVAGRGVGVDYVARFAHSLEWEVLAVSPDKATLARVAPIATTHHLTQPDDFDPSLVDAATAVVLLFHDHEWEPPILHACAATPAFYIGALGSRRTHAQRCMLLQARGCDRAFIARIRSPVGLSIRAANPPEIALAIVAEILSLVPTE